MKAILKTEAIVLGSIPLGEIHKIIYFLTPSDGILKGVAYGIKKSTNKFSSSMELLNRIELTLNLSKNSDLHKIKEFYLISSRQSLRDNKNAFGIIFYLGEFLIKFFTHSQANENVYSLIDYYIEALIKSPYVIFRSLLIKILHSQGFISEPGKCSNCGIESEILHISERHGYIFCKNCTRPAFDTELKPGTVKIIKKMFISDLNEIVNLKLTNTQIGELNFIFDKIIHSILGYQIKSGKSLHLCFK